MFTLTALIKCWQCGYISPSSIVLGENEKITLQCNSLDKPTWSKENGTIREIHRRMYYYLLLINVTEEDSGIYNCEGHLNDGAYFEASAEVLVGGMFNAKKY